MYRILLILNVKHVFVICLVKTRQEVKRQVVTCITNNTYQTCVCKQFKLERLNTLTNIQYLISLYVLTLYAIIYQQKCTSPPSLPYVMCIY